MSEEKNISKPLQLWNQAVKAVKGDTAGQMVEQFTAEMTLVAEGLCEDQARLRKSVEDLARMQERSGQSLSSEIAALENTMREHQRDTDRRLEELYRRLNAMEGKKKKESGKPSWMNQAILLVSIVCGSWVLVTILQLLR